MGEAKRRKKLDSNWGKRKILIDSTGTFIVDEDILIEYDSEKYEITTDVITWKEAIDILDEQKNITRDNYDEFAEEDLNGKAVVIVAKEIKKKQESSFQLCQNQVNRV